MSFIVDQARLTQTSNRLLERFVDRVSHFEMFMELNEAILDMTGSEYGFVARVFRNEKGPFIKTVALSNIAWNDETRRLYAENAERGMVFSNVETLFGQVLKTGKIYVSLDAPNDPNAAGIPAGHPPLNCFVGLPLVRNDVLIGMIGLANGAGYCEAMEVALKPLLDVTTQILYATGLQQPLVPEGNYFAQPQAMLSKFNSGVMTVDVEGRVTSSNLAVTMIFGYTRDELVGMRIQSLIPPAGGSEMYDSDGALRLHEAQYGCTFEATGVSKVQSYFPIEAMFGESGSEAGVETGKGTERGADPQYTIVVRDIAEEKKRERFKNEFISMVSHELRTPLTTVYISLSILDDHRHRPKSADEFNEMVSIATRNCERLVRLVDEILDYEKLNLNEIEFNFESVQLDQIFEMARETTRVVAEQAGVSLEFQICGPDLRVAADATRMSQVLVNLIANAIRASEPGGNVRVGCEQVADQQRVSVFVEDQGKGICPASINEVFEPFKQLEQQTGGAGLGLAICKRFVENHGSQISCESTLGQGTRFQFDLFKYCDISEGNIGLVNGRVNNAPKNVLWIESNESHYQFA